MADTSPSADELFHVAAALLAEADGLLITAGAGFGIDSGLPDFRGDHGFWNAYPALGKIGMRFVEIANPQAFATQPKIAWGFYGHRLQLYRETMPHEGFAHFLRISQRLPNGCFVFTSNVDGHFQKAGFDAGHIMECHGSIHHLQCTQNCGTVIWAADDFHPEVDHASCRLTSALPTCPQCGALARPNILMFGDWRWDESRCEKQEARLRAWLARVDMPVVIEVGAGMAVPTVRRFSESLHCPLIRINPTESQVARRQDLAIPLGALDGMRGIALAFDAL